MLQVTPVSTVPLADDWHRGLARHAITCTPWEDKFDYRPTVDFCIAHDDIRIYLHYRVREKSIRAHTNAPNGEVWKDSCVEFFISPTEDDHYYNFEFNCIGAIRLSSGQGRHNRQKATNELLSQIHVVASLGSDIFTEKTGDFTWELSVSIPVACFFEHHITHLSGLRCTANFYKCGDDLSTPHYLSWQPIDTPNPDFHTPRFFKQLIFG